MKQTIYLFGDSIIAGEGDPMGGGWAGRLQNHLDADIHNFAVSGATTDDLLRLFQAKAEGQSPDTIIIGIGINDSKYIGEDGENYAVPPDRFRENLKELTEQAKQITGDVVFLGLTDVDEARTLPVFWDGQATDTYFHKSNVSLYNAIIAKVSEENGSTFIDMLGLLDSSDLDDGLHPNTKGYEKMFTKIKLFLKNQE